MRNISNLHPTDGVPMAPDTIFTFLLTGGSSAQASDWLSIGSTAVANAAAAGVDIVRLTGMTTAGAAFAFTANLLSTAAGALSSGLSSGGSTNANSPIATGPVMFQVPGGSTGFSVGAATSGFVVVEMWGK